MLVVQLVKHPLFMQAQQFRLGCPVYLFSGIHTEKIDRSAAENGCALRDATVKGTKESNISKWLNP